MANRNMDSRAHSAVYKAVKNGDLPHISERDCERCGKQAAVYHHDDYDKYLDVTPLCKKCHSAVHREWAREMTPEDALAWLRFGEMLRKFDAFAGTSALNRTD